MFKYFVPTFCTDTEVWFESRTSAGFERFHNCTKASKKPLAQIYSCFWLTTLTHLPWTCTLCVNPSHSVVTRTNHPAVWVMTQWNPSITYAVRGIVFQRKKRRTLSQITSPKNVPESSLCSRRLFKLKTSGVNTLAFSLHTWPLHVYICGVWLILCRPWILSGRSQNKPTRLKLSPVDATYLDFWNICIC